MTESHDTFELVAARLEIVEARYVRAYYSLAALVDYVRRSNAFMFAEEQSILCVAESVLAEHKP